MSPLTDWKIIVYNEAISLCQKGIAAYIFTFIASILAIFTIAEKIADPKRIL